MKHVHVTFTKDGASLNITEHFSNNIFTQTEILKSGNPKFYDDVVKVLGNHLEGSNARQMSVAEYEAFAQDINTEIKKAEVNQLYLEQGQTND